MMDLGLSLPTHHVPKFYAPILPCTKVLCLKPIQLPIFNNCQTHPCTKNIDTYIYEYRFQLFHFFISKCLRIVLKIIIFDVKIY